MFPRYAPILFTNGDIPNSAIALYSMGTGNIVPGVTNEYHRRDIGTAVSVVIDASISSPFRAIGRDTAVPGFGCCERVRRTGPTYVIEAAAPGQCDARDGGCGYPSRYRREVRRTVRGLDVRPPSFAPCDAPPGFGWPTDHPKRYAGYSSTTTDTAMPTSLPITLDGSGWMRR
ncbi:MAG: hypothetical protein IPK16_15720 [Anaerolineales bacterium]|nr:hypothetical protein [Anaerolineales bacterium]